MLLNAAAIAAVLGTRGADDAPGDDDLRAVPAVPHPRQVRPEIVQLEARIAELEVRRQAVEWDRADLERRLGEFRGGEEALAVLHAEHLPECLDPGPSRAELRRQLQEKDAEAALLGRVIRAGRDEVEKLTRLAAAPALAAAVEWQRRLAARLARMLCETQRLARLELELEAAADAVGLSLSPRGPREVLGWPGDPEGAVGWWITRLIGDGVLTGTEPWLEGSGLGRAEAAAREERRADLARLTSR